MFLYGAVTQHKCAIYLLMFRTKWFVYCLQIQFSYFLLLFAIQVKQYLKGVIISISIHLALELQDSKNLPRVQYTNSILGKIDKTTVCTHTVGTVLVRTIRIHCTVHQRALLQQHKSTYSTLFMILCLIVSQQEVIRTTVPSKYSIDATHCTVPGTVPISKTRLY